MGDGADLALEGIYDDDDARVKYLSGHMNHEEAYDAGVIDEDGAMYTPGRSSMGTCRYCHKPNLEWRDTKWGKRLFDGDVFHTCPEYKQAKTSAKPQQSQDDLVPALQRLTDAVNRLYTVTSSLRDEMNRFYNAKYGHNTGCR